MQTRRTFLGGLAVFTCALLNVPRPLVAQSERRGPWPHPAPRPGIDGSHVLRKEQLANANAAPVFDMVRQIPQVVDGIRCHCGCADAPGFRSLLSCFEKDGMAQDCEICQGQAKLAFELHGNGKSLDDIRAAIDARFG